MFLEVKGLTKRFGGLLAVNQLDLTVNKGEIAGLIGPNGAGKTTTFNLITSVLQPTKGRVIFNGEDITYEKSHAIARKGIARTFQLNPLFGDFDVLQNVSTAFYISDTSNLFDMYFNTNKHRRNQKMIMEKSHEIIKMLGLEQVKNVLARNLPHGHQKMLGIARALAAEPQLLLLDEPIAGMNPDEVEAILKAINKIHEQGITVLVIEHNMMMMDICNRVIVMNFGQKIAEGTPQEIRDNEEVQSAYLGGV
ncbi:MAG: ABC transporter ATP-binding protein [Firmicutes bacterium]|jgi:branched-chain amino acid transport system ATP-binding protein|nr:ABC transporter ATP-binding protein [Bacillota bacterium]